MVEQPPRLIVGLGNPGPEYAGHRHNVGFRVVDALARELGLVFRSTGHGYALATDAGAAGELILLKPQTFMNRSGDALLAWSHCAGWAVTGVSQRREPAPDDTTMGAEVGVMDDSEPTVPSVRPMVVCDDLALPLGALRLRVRGGSGGQNGMASLIAAVGGEEFPRLRLGVAPTAGPPDPADWADHVLSDFTPDEAPLVAETVRHACAALICWLEEGLEAAASRHNRRVVPPAN